MTAQLEDPWLAWAKMRTAHPGWHGPRTAEDEAERERQHQQWRTEQLALEARQSANPMWQRVYDALGISESPCYGCGGTQPEDVDAVMDTIYGKGQW